MFALFNDSITIKWFIHRLIVWEENEYKVRKELKEAVVTTSLFYINILPK
jgi:hypothetical protein